MGAESKRRLLAALPATWGVEGKRVLDFGCGAGRTLRHFIPEARTADFHGCDIDEPSIEWMDAHLSPPLHVFVNRESPPLERPDESFDLIYCLSVFTHLTESWSAWLLELRRLLRPDGFLIATFLGPERAARVLPPEVASHGIDPDRIGMNELAHGRPWDFGGPLVVHSPWWIHAHWGRAFEIVRLEEGGFWEDWDQGFVVMRKRAGELSVGDLELPEPGEPRELAAARENVRQLGRQLAPFWERMYELRERQAALRAQVAGLREARSAERQRLAQLQRELKALRGTRSRGGP